APVDTTQIRATFDSLRSAFEQAVAAGDFEAQAGIFTADGVYSPPMAPPIRGRDSIRAVLERTMPPGATADIQPIEMRILGRDWVYEFGTTTLSFTPEGANQPRKTTGTYSTLFHRTENGWKVTHEAFSSNAPPPGAQ
ncbi:MAG: SgcJ/EcaC family oxidoreductase, partial [Salinivenus sp.]